MSLRTAIDVLYRRVETLTDLANQNGISIPPLSGDEQSLLDQICANLELPLDRILPGMKSSESHISRLDPVALSDTPLPGIALLDDSLMYTAIPEDCQQNSTMTYDFQTWADFTTIGLWDGSPSDWPWQILNNPIAEMNLPTELPVSNVSSDDEGDANIVPRLAARFGSLRVSHDGSLRYYGSASNHHFLGKPVHSDLDDKAHDIERECAIALETAQLDREVPFDLQEHLIDLFFKWHNTSHSTVDRATFESARLQENGGKLGFCSQSLVSVICALGAAFSERYHASFITFPKPMASFFADKSKVLLEVELESPNVTTVQTLLLLSSHEATNGHDARVWLYSGMAMRLAFALGLHVDSTPFVEQGLISAKEADARKKTFWSCLVVN
ncbi:hypothetical protein LTR84_010051 [Exophiala bonariae]|uniref:Xylanolytic transcriptional activator regulatory domain-containing protein n=1 Tax=Exophiala bonariae TaxID=1690606 RepID=A0AAV9NK32_9EURO|nr:hypothetical protein LTR84_010051 [Exophiala bonariae]